MDAAIDVNEQSLAALSSDLLKILLTDKTTRKFIRWGSDNYKQYGPEYYTDQEIKPALITGINGTIIHPRVTKVFEQKAKRTRDRAEVFTPSWICNTQNNLVDAAWFGRDNVFNITNGQEWHTNKEPVYFPEDKSWQSYVDARRMEVSCGEAPYLASRYDTVSGEIIPIDERVGIVDRKIRIVNENAKNDKEWSEWIVRAFQSSYGYDLQGDNVLLSRENLLYTYIDYYKDRFKADPSISDMKKIAKILSWNIWQMNGITMTAPYSLAEPVYHQTDFFDIIGVDAEEEYPANNVNEMPCRIYDWRANRSVEFRSLVK